MSINTIVLVSARNSYSFVPTFNIYYLYLYNDRYVDMIANPEVADVFRTRAKVAILTAWGSWITF